MHPAAKLAAFALALAVALGAGAAVGAAVGPLDDDDPVEQQDGRGEHGGDHG